MPGRGFSKGGIAERCVKKACGPHIERINASDQTRRPAKPSLDFCQHIKDLERQALPARPPGAIPRPLGPAVRYAPFHLPPTSQIGPLCLFVNVSRVWARRRVYGVWVLDWRILLGLTASSDNLNFGTTMT